MTGQGGLGLGANPETSDAALPENVWRGLTLYRSPDAAKKPSCKKADRRVEVQAASNCVDISLRAGSDIEKTCSLSHRRRAGGLAGSRHEFARRC